MSATSIFEQKVQHAIILVTKLRRPPMTNFSNKVFSREGFTFISYTIILFIIEQFIFRALFSISLQDYWALSLIVLPIIIIFIGKLSNRTKLSTQLIYSISLSSGILMFISLNLRHFNTYIMKNFNIAVLIAVILLLINLISPKSKVKKEKKIFNTESDKNVFNLFYINTPKAHEIAMLIDNKIMKAIENEQVSEELLRHSSTLSLKANEQVGLESGYSKEENSKVRVYENFDVKTTKSIMLRKIYDSINKGDGKNNFNTGDLVLFENIELNQKNTDDTAMILNVLQDSQIKNDSDDDIELNLNKMVDRILDDFSIDYTFSYGKNEEKKYLIQLPFNNDSNFENGYRHDDLQLGKLSLIGIYRGEIDFSKKESTSSKFLQMISDSYNEPPKESKKALMKPSTENLENLNNPFKLKYEKLNESLHLVDVIAIIQDLKIESDEEN